MLTPVPQFGRSSLAPVIRFGATARRAEPKPVIVTGTGTVERMPDTMHIGISLEEDGQTRQAVTESLNTKSASLIGALKALNLPKTVRIASRFSPVNPVYQWNGQKQQKNGYHGSFNVSITEKGGNHEEFPDHAAKIKQVADDADAPFSGPHYDISNREEAELEALGNAVKDASVKAKTVATALGVDLAEKPDSVEIGASDPYRGGGGPKRAFAAMGAMDGGAPGGASAESFEIAPIVIQSEPVRVQFSINA